MPTTVVIATASVLIQRGLAALLGDLTEIRISGAANTLDEAVRVVREHRPHVVILDPTWMTALGSRLREAHFERVLLLSPKAHLGDTQFQVAEYACGFVSERASQRHLRNAIRMVGACLSHFGQGYCNSCPLRSTLEPPPLPLSEREGHVFRAISRGETTSQIAESLKLSVKTIETYRESIKRKLGLDSGLALLEAAVQWKAGELIPRQAHAQPFDPDTEPAAESRSPRRRRAAA